MSELLKWIKNYYVGEGIDNPEEIRKKTEEKEAPKWVYLLTAPVNKANVMDLIQAKQLENRFCYDSCPLILGMAKGKDGAIELASKILLECQKDTGNFQVEEYLKNR